jgi:molybdopterin molybdotransferase
MTEDPSLKVRMSEFLSVITSDEAVALLASFRRLQSECVPLDCSVGRILAEAVIAPENLPERPRSTVDGYAVRAEDTYGASDASPALLGVATAVPMGVLSRTVVGIGQAAQIATGGFLPEGPNAVVMVEHTSKVDGFSIEVMRPVTIGANVLHPGEDARAGSPIVAAGTLMRPAEAGLLAALGITKARVYRRAKVAIISTGDELVPFDRQPKPGQIRDANAHAIAALVRMLGAEPQVYPIVTDSPDLTIGTLHDALATADVVVLSGGSSIGVRDVMAEAVAAVREVEVLAHGLAIRPGKPTLLGRCGDRAIFGLPGHPVSALIVAYIFLAPFLSYLQGGPLEKGPLGERVKARLGCSMHSTIGLEEFVRVRLTHGLGTCPVVEPVFGKSAMLSTITRANGLLVIPQHAEGLAKGDMVEVVRI